MDTVTDTDTDLGEIRELTRNILKTEDERDTLLVRDGVKFDRCIEILFCDKVGTIPRANLPSIKMYSGGLESFLSNFISKLQTGRLPQSSSCSQCGCPIQHYAYGDIPKEINWALQSILLQSGKIDKINLPDSPVANRREVNYISEYLVKAVNSLERDNRILASPVGKLPMPDRAIRILNENGINSVQDLINHSIEEIKSIEGIGDSIMSTIRYAVERLRLKFREEESN